MMNKVSEWISSHKWETIGAIVAAGLLWLLSRGGSSSGAVAASGPNPNVLAAQTQLALQAGQAQMASNEQQVSLQAQQNTLSAQLAGLVSNNQTAQSIATMQAQIAAHTADLQGNVAVVNSNNTLAAAENTNSTNLAITNSNNRVLTTQLTTQAATQQEALRQTTAQQQSNNATAVAIQKTNADYLTTISTNQTLAQINRDNAVASVTNTTTAAQRDVINNEVTTAGNVAVAGINSQSQIYGRAFDTINSGVLNKGGEGGVNQTAAFTSVFGQAGAVAGPGYGAAASTMNAPWNFVSHLVDDAATAYSFAL